LGRVGHGHAREHAIERLGDALGSDRLHQEAERA
jgi:hypothetical protein